ncbi:plastocyanin/azurin family copper-binding protein [Aequorivita capsosiphonis]|uniref:plastocyanin/azurin family copper-binding protein n=1 Tax=Aequorivita capsosiphonis TaxID=487317 RepID=UPI000407B39A|nr:plastocyanin/azurin family copper-binding protein [Aequorivita capsosiphonis]
MKTVRKSIIALTVFSIGLVTIFFLSTGFKKMETNQKTPTTHIVTIYQMKFDPENIKVKKGDIVEWVNKDFVPHDVTEIDKKWTSKPLKQDDTFSKVITKDFNYFCSIHLVMKGSVTVTN